MLTAVDLWMPTFKPVAETTFRMWSVIPTHPTSNHTNKKLQILYEQIILSAVTARASSAEPSWGLQARPSLQEVFPFPQRSWDTAAQATCGALTAQHLHLDQTKAWHRQPRAAAHVSKGQHTDMCPIAPLPGLGEGCDLLPPCQDKEGTFQTQLSRVSWLFHHQPGLSQQDRGYVEVLFTAPWNARRKWLASFSLLVIFSHL